MLGSYGEGDGQLRYPHGLALSEDGTLFVADSSNGRIVAFDSEGVFKYAFPLQRGPSRTRPLLQALGHLAPPVAHARPAGLVLCAGELFATDAYNRRLQVFSTSGEFKRFLQPTYLEGPLRGQLMLVLPEGITSANSRLYVSDKRGDAVFVLDPTDGTPLQVLTFQVSKPHGLSGCASDGTRIFVLDEPRAELQVLTTALKSTDAETAAREKRFEASPRGSARAGGGGGSARVEASPRQHGGGSGLVSSMVSSALGGDYKGRASGHNSSGVSAPGMSSVGTSTVGGGDGDGPRPLLGGPLSLKRVHSDAAAAAAAARQSAFAAPLLSARSAASSLSTPRGSFSSTPRRGGAPRPRRLASYSAGSKIKLEVVV